MTDNVNAVQGKSQEDLLHKTISHLSAEQINELYDHLFPLRNILNDVNSEALKTISEGKIDLPAVDQITSLLDKAEKMSQSKTVTDQKVQALFSTFTVTDQVKSASYIPRTREKAAHIPAMYYQIDDEEYMVKSRYVHPSPFGVEEGYPPFIRKRKKFKQNTDSTLLTDWRYSYAEPVEITKDT